MAKRKSASFRSEWLTDPTLTWIARVPDDNNSARCCWCNIKFSLSNMGRRAVTSHMVGKKHLQWAESCNSVKVDAFFKPVPNEKNNSGSSMTSAEDSLLSGSPPLLPSKSHVSLQSNELGQPSTSQCAIQPTKSSTSGMKTFLLNERVTEAEILWCIQSVVTHKSLRAAGRDVQLFQKMFPDSEIATKLQLQRDKVGYCITFGLAPYFRDEISRRLEDQLVVIGFDESLNKITQKQQMDISVRFWDLECDEVVTRYYTSVFLGKSTAAHLLSSFKDGVKNLSLNNILQISMDGPNVNFKFLQELRNDIKSSSEEQSPEMLDLGSCGLHTVNCAFKAGFVCTEWKLIDFLRALYNLFKDVPARRALYTSLTASELFPKKFCAIRWVENSSVAQRALDILPFVVKFVTAVEKDKKLMPLCNSFKIVAEFTKDPLLPAKLSFFKALASDIEPFLTEFQSDVPLVPFLHSALSIVIHDQMQYIVKPDVLKSSAFIHKLDVNKDDNLLFAKNIKLPFSVTYELKKVKSAKERDVLLFRESCRKCIQKFISKLVERSPLAYKLTRAVSCFDPNIAANVDLGSKRLTVLLTSLTDSKWLNSTVADKALREYECVCSQPKVQDSLKTFSRKSQRVDNFWTNLLKECTDIENIARIVKLVMILSHGNANLERGFSVNLESLQPNMKEESLVARRCVYDSIVQSGGIEKFVVTKKLIHSVRNAYSRFKEAVELRKKDETLKKENAAKKRKSELLIKELQEKKSKLIEDARKQSDLIDEEISSLK